MMPSQPLHKLVVDTSDIPQRQLSQPWVSLDPSLQLDTRDSGALDHQLLQPRQFEVLQMLMPDARDSIPDWASGQEKRRRPETSWQARIM